MLYWWNGLPLEQQIFFAIGLIATAITVIQMILTIIGFGAESLELEFEIEGGEGDHSSGVGIFSSQTISAFFLAFGWVGGVSLQQGFALGLAVLLAFALGIASMFSMFYLIKSLLSLQSKGNIEYSGAVGDTATVYVTIPGENNDGGGQIQVLIQSRLVTASARKESAGPMNPGEKCLIVGMAGPVSFLVEPLA